MLEPSDLHPYQQRCVKHQLEHQHSMLWLSMGLGKTAVTLTTIVERMRRGSVKRTLIVGPLRVVQSVWRAEARKWSHTRHLTFSLIAGSASKREVALFQNADVFLINYENLNWFCTQMGHHYITGKMPWPFQMVVFDEVSRMKNSTSLRVAGGVRDRKDKHGVHHSVRVPGWRSMLPYFPYTTGLTGTPASNGYLDLHGQYLVIDGGKRLGTRITHYRANYFHQSYDGWGYDPTPEGVKMIQTQIADITVEMSAEDYLTMPPVTTVDIHVDLPAKARKAYGEMESVLFTELDSGQDLEVFSAAAVSNKLLQISNGGPYLEPGEPAFAPLHDAKLEALEDVLEEAAGQPVLCSYSYRADAERIMKKFRRYHPVNLTAAPASHTSGIIERWQAGNIRLLIGHPASMGHGIDGLQTSGSIVVWFGLNWSLELYEQMNGRIYRQGQTKPVQIIRILARDTLDEAVSDALASKDSDQSGLRAAINRYRVKDLRGFL